MANNIRALRLAKNETQQQLAQYLGVSTFAVSLWENGHRTPNIDNLLQMSDHFECSLDELLGRKAVRA